jgi:predicted nucleic acid-binding protein
VILVDTSVWADHFGKPLDALSRLMTREQILQHPFVTGELALGNPRDRPAMITLLDALPQAEVDDWGDLLEFAARHDLGGTGIGYVDAHLLASAHRHRTRLWSKDKRLASQAGRLGLAYEPD